MERRPTVIDDEYDIFKANSKLGYVDMAKKTTFVHLTDENTDENTRTGL